MATAPKPPSRTEIINGYLEEYRIFALNQAKEDPRASSGAYLSRRRLMKWDREHNQRRLEEYAGTDEQVRERGLLDFYGRILNNFLMIRGFDAPRQAGVAPNVTYSTTAADKPPFPMRALIRKKYIPGWSEQECRAAVAEQKLVVWRAKERMEYYRAAPTEMKEFFYDVAEDRNRPIPPTRREESTT